MNFTTTRPQLNPLPVHVSWIRYGFALGPILIMVFLVMAGCQGKTPGDRVEEEGSESDPKLAARLKAENLARFWKDLSQFESLSIDDQKKLIEFHNQLVALEPLDRQRLWHGAELFSLWLNSLPEDDKIHYFSLAETSEKLAFIRKKRDEQWLINLPKADQDRIKGLDSQLDDRALLISRLKVEEVERRTRFLDLVMRPPSPGGNLPGGSPKGGNPGPLLFASARPAKFEEMPKEVQKWVQQQLQPRLTQSEQAQLKKAEGQWPNYPRTIYQLTRDHFLLPGRGNELIGSYPALPGFIKEKISQEKLDQAFRKRGIVPRQEQWPDFALSISQILKDQNAATGFLGPSNLNGLPRLWRNLVEKELLPKLDLEGKGFLRRAEGKWPDYPRNLVDMMMIRGIPVPGNVLPAPLGIWRDAMTPN